MTTSLRIGGAVAMTFALVASFLPGSNWLWGVNLLRFYPAWFRVGWFVLGLGAFLAASRFDLPAPGTPWRKLPPWAMALAAGVVAAVVLHLARARCGLLGDGYQILVDLKQGNPPAIRSPLYNLLEPRLVRWLDHGGTPTLTEGGLLSTITGVVVTILVTWILARRARDGEPLSSAALGFLILLQPAMQLFFGYIESYALLAGASIVFFVTLLSWQETGRGFVAAVVAFMVALASHPFGWPLLIPLVAAAMLRPEGRRGRLLLLALIGVAILGAGVLLAGGAGRTPEAGSPFAYLDLRAVIAQGMRTFAPRASGGTLFGLATIWSWQQLADILNQLWLTGAPALIVLLSLSATASGRRATGARLARAPMLAALAFLLLRGGMRTILGPMRDWDLFSGVGIALTAWGAAACAGAIRESAPVEGDASPAPPRRLVPMIAALSLFFLVPWIGMQADSERAVKRHLALVDGSPKMEAPVAATFHSAMGLRLLQLGQIEFAANAFEMAWSLNPSWNYAWHAGLAFASSGRMEKAAAAFSEMTKKRPDDWRGWAELGSAWTSMGRLDRAEPALRRAVALDDRQAASHVYLARLLALEGHDREARLQLEAARSHLAPLDPIRTDFDLLDQTIPPLYATPGR